jgi:hypothetical protein
MFRDQIWFTRTKNNLPIKRMPEVTYRRSRLADLSLFYDPCSTLLKLRVCLDLLVHIIFHSVSHFMIRNGSDRARNRRSNRNSKRDRGMILVQGSRGIQKI